MSSAINAASEQRLRWRSGAESAQDWLSLTDNDANAQTFWGQYLHRVGSRLQARRVLLLAGTVGKPWQALAQWPAKAQVAAEDAALVQQATISLVTDLPQLTEGEQGVQALTMRLPHAPAAPEQVLALVVLRDAPFEAQAEAWLAWAGLMAALPAWYARLATARAKERSLQLAAETTAEAVPAPAQNPAVQRAERLYDLLQLAVRLWGQTRFVRQSFELCGELAQRYQADRVSLGWREGAYLRLVAISQIEKFDAKAAAVRALEAAMEEAADQPGDLCFPLPDGSRHVERAHATYARLQGTHHVLSVPLRQVNHEAAGVLTLERNTAAFTDEERWELTELAALVVHPIHHLHELDRWWGERLWRSSRVAMRDWLGPRHSAWKLTLGSVVVALLVTVLIPWDYRVETALNLRSKDVLFMPAPFDGYLSEVHVEIGETVRQGQVLAALDTRDLTLEASMARADLTRFAREAEKAQAARQFAEMQITLARQQQAASRLALVENQLSQAQVLAPHDGIIIEGDLKKNLGAPLRKGDLLLKLAQTDEITVEVSIDEVDVHEVQTGTVGEFALVGRPDQRFAMSLASIDPVATLKEGHNIYRARARFEGAVPDWWRPGMGGTARLEVGERSLLWVLTHRTVRFLRQVFWI